MRSGLMRETCTNEFVSMHVAFGLTKALDGDENEQLTLLCPGCSQANDQTFRDKNGK